MFASCERHVLFNYNIILADPRAVYTYVCQMLTLEEHSLD